MSVRGVAWSVHILAKLTFDHRMYCHRPTGHRDPFKWVTGADRLRV